MTFCQGPKSWRLSKINSDLKFSHVHGVKHKYYLLCVKLHCNCLLGNRTGFVDIANKIRKTLIGGERARFFGSGADEWPRICPRQAQARKFRFLA